MASAACDDKKDNGSNQLQSNGIDAELNEERREMRKVAIDRTMLLQCFQQNDFVKAEEIAKILLDNAREAHGRESEQAWSASMEYIEVQKRLKKDKVALQLYLELEPVTIKLFGDDHENSSSVFNNIAMLYYHTFQHSKTIPYFKKTLAIWEKIYPANDQRVVVTRNNIAVNQQMSYFDFQSQKHGVKIEKMDFTRDLAGRKPESHDQDDNDNNDDFKNDPKRMASFQAAIDEQFGSNYNQIDDEQKQKVVSDKDVSNNNDSTQQTDNAQPSDANIQK